jgi:hypothetical protein
LPTLSLAKDPPSLPPALVNATGGKTSGKLKAAEAMNTYFITKVDTLRAAALADPAGESVDQEMDVTIPMVETVKLASDAASLATEAADPAGDESTQATNVPVLATDSANEFTFTFAKAGGIAEIIRGLKNTEAMGIDDIPTSVLKKGVEVLAGPISHHVNRSLAEGRVPEAFKVGKVFPVFRGKQRKDPSSYRPISILPALSKVLETSVKADLEMHLAKVNGLPNVQHGFRPSRSCTTALAHSHAGWLTGSERGQVVGIIAFDLSAAFDTVADEQPLLKLQSLGVSGRALVWFKSYLTGGSQQVSWDGTLSDLIGRSCRA